ncbi:MAG TPA: hypothetical protein PK323_11940 [Bacteroidia bacterium]|nr:hypothetical protein [Bacteroidia bacterium]
MESIKEISSHERHIVADILGLSKITVDQVINGRRNNELVLEACKNIVIMRQDMIEQLTKLMESLAKEKAVEFRN